MSGQVGKILQNPIVGKIIRTAKPWLTALAIVLILRYTGMLAGISSFTQRTLVQSGMLSANPDNSPERTEAFDYSLIVRTLDNKAVPLSQFKGKTLFINLWATWCGPCRAEMPSIQNLYNKVNSDSIVFIMLSLDAEDQVHKVRKYIDKAGYTFPVYIAGELTPQTSVDVIPTTFIVGPDGTLDYVKSGMADYDTKKFVKYLQKLSSGTPDQ